MFCEGGALVLNGLKTSSGAYGNENLAIKRNPSGANRGTFASEERLVYHEDLSWASEVSHFFDCICTARPPALGHSGDALAVMRLIDRIYASQRVDAEQTEHTII